MKKKIETAYCYSIDDAKVASIFFDRVLAFEGVLEAERSIAVKMGLKDRLKKEIEERKLNIDSLNTRIFTYNGPVAGKSTCGLIIDLLPESKKSRSMHLKNTKQSFTEFSTSNDHTGILDPIVLRDVVYEFVDKPKKRSKSKSIIKGIDLILDEIPVIQPHGLEWEQIIELRKDKSTIRKLRMIRYFLFDLFQKHSPQQASDIIAQKLEDYNNAIIKHGMNTKLGLVKHLLDSKTLGSVILGGGIPTFLGNELIALITAGSIGLGQAGIYIAERKISMKESLSLNHDAEISFLYEVKKKFS